MAIPTNLNNYLGDFTAPKLPLIKAAFIGLGDRGKVHVRNFSKLANCEIVAFSDLYEDNVLQSKQIVAKNTP